MEEFLILLFQVLLELFINLPWDFFWYREPRVDAKNSRPIWIGFWSLVIGAVVGGLSLLLFPDVIAKRAWLRIFLLFFAPVFAGTTGYWSARLRSARRHYVVPSQHFWWSCMFSLGYVIIRFVYADRP